ncbi:guanylate kinase [Magnetospirillum aberrantis]|uniref:Guanylate kinase n=1 Tax=Magnetospirillum aberrantis SpK TaxID=908842 RepID=A0A7C9UW78_9PROT|nr:guanylate kinase [Magnetospirillum aberrantis]NFV80529.1 guanylate kinase [Magnetospirillum aberrantis SpK]
MSTPPANLPTVARRGLMLVLSSPSGAGKSTIARALLERDPDIAMSVSCTTRPPRPGEVDGKDYHFVSVEKFQLMVESDQFLEHARVFDNYYGTPRDPVEDALASGRDVLFDIDWQGTQQLGQNARADLVTVFILPPSVEELERRLRTRAQDTVEVVKKRMAKAGDEMSHWFEYDYILLNTEVDRSIARVQAILDAERLKRDRQVGMAAFVNRLRGE